MQSEEFAILELVNVTEGAATHQTRLTIQILIKGILYQWLLGDECVIAPRLEPGGGTGL